MNYTADEMRIERRIDPNDGVTYSQAEFSDAYGDNSSEWRTAIAPEHRIDIDGLPYTFRQFVEAYGDNPPQWDTAKHLPDTTECRIDPVDDVAYTHDEFVEAYGHNPAQWESASKVKTIVGNVASEDGARACTAYEADMLSDTVGVCKCGFPRKHHSQIALVVVAKSKATQKTGTAGLAATKSLPITRDHVGHFRADRNRALVSIGTLQESYMSGCSKSFAVATDAGVACSTYQIDLTAATFGQCRCGYGKGAHKSSLVSSKESNRSVGSGVGGSAYMSLPAKVTTLHAARISADIAPTLPASSAQPAGRAEGAESGRKAGMKNVTNHSGTEKAAQLVVEDKKEAAEVVTTKKLASAELAMKHTAVVAANEAVQGGPLASAKPETSTDTARARTEQGASVAELEEARREIDALETASRKRDRDHAKIMAIYMKEVEVLKHENQLLKTTAEELCELKKTESEKDPGGIPDGGNSPFFCAPLLWALPWECPNC